MTNNIASGKLYIVATPIGNLEDITLRALRILKEADVIAAEDTRVTRKLLSHFDIHTHMIAYHQHSMASRAEELMNMLKEGKNVALVSDAGTPGISDPGHELIALAILEGLAVESIPGATAVITALVISGLPTSHFTFDGFPPRKENERNAFFKGLKREDRTVCLYESPMRLVKTLQTMLKEMGDREIAVVREATKMFEEVCRGHISEVIEHFTEKKPRGEIVIVIKGASAKEVEEATLPEISLEDRLIYLMGTGVSERDAVRRCMIEFKLSKRHVYPTALKIKENSGTSSQTL